MRSKAFTLVELLVTIAIIGLLSTIVVISFSEVKQKAFLAKVKINQGEIDLYCAINPGGEVEIDGTIYYCGIGRWNFDEGSGSIVYDSSGYGNDGARNGATWACAIDDINNTPSGQGCSLSFDGVDDYVELSQLLPIFNKSFTVSMWIKAFSEIDGRWGILLGDFGLGGLEVNFELSTNGRTRLYWNSSPDLIGTKTLQKNTWYLITFVRDKGKKTVKSYVNSEIDINYSGEISDKTATVNHRIGRDNRTGSTAFGPGLIDSVYIYSVPLTLEQIQSQYYVGLNNLLAKGLITEKEHQERLIFDK